MKSKIHLMIGKYMCMPEVVISISDWCGHVFVNLELVHRVALFCFLCTVGLTFLSFQISHT